MATVTETTENERTPDLKGRVLDFVSKRGEPRLEEVVEAMEDQRSVEAVRGLVASGALSLAAVGYAWGVDFHVRLTR